MKRFLTLPLLVSSLFLLFVTCQKTIVVQQNSNAIASGTLKDSSGNCMFDSVKGTFYNGVPPGRDTCFLQLKVDVTDTGRYAVYTDSVNGFGFADTGYFHETGIHFLKLKPIGTPHIIDTTDFTVHFNNDSCFFSIPVKDSTGLQYFDLTKDATGTMKDDEDNCFPIEIFGDYYKDISLAGTNYVRVTVNIIYPGNFKISTDTVNGFYFNTEQQIIDPGVYIFDLRGHGKPTHIETSRFLVKFNGEGCPFNITSKDSSERIILKPAVYEANENMCRNAEVSYPYPTIRTPLALNNTIMLQVNVTNLGDGTYGMGTGSKNGFAYSTTGIFNSTGIQNVTLYGYGTPERAGHTSLPITIHSGSGFTSCDISVLVTDMPGHDTATNSWVFSEGQNYYQGIFAYPDVYFGENSSSDGKQLTLHGTDVWDEIDTVINMVVQFPESATAPIPGIYISDPYPDHTHTNEFNFKLINSETFIYTSKAASLNNEKTLTITITACDVDNRIVEGIFSGHVLDKEGNIVNITNGKFKAKY